MRRRAVLLLPAALAARCAAPPPPPAVLELAITGGADQNPGAGGAAAPVAVRLIQLAATARFERADVFDLIEREKATLADDDLGSEEFVIRPGETRSVTRELKKGAQFLGVAVLFRDIDRAKWRAVAPLAPSGPTRLKLSISGVTFVLSPA